MQQARGLQHSAHARVRTSSGSSYGAVSLRERAQGSGGGAADSALFFSPPVPDRAAGCAAAKPDYAGAFRAMRRSSSARRLPRHLVGEEAARNMWSCRTACRRCRSISARIRSNGTGGRLSCNSSRLFAASSPTRSGGWQASGRA